MTVQPADPPFVVVGGGPVGLVTALLLAGQGLRTVLLERDAEPHGGPRAAHLDDEALRVFQQLGVLDAMGPHLNPTPAYELLDADGRRLARIARAGEPLGHPRSVLIHQPGVEAVLRDAAERHPLVEVRLGWEVVDLRAAGPARVTARTADGEQQILRAEAILACDGASSTVRRLLGIGSDDRGFAQRWLVLDLQLDRRPRRLHLPQQHCDPARPTTSVPIGPNRHRFEVLLRPDEDDAAALDPRTIGGHLVRLLGVRPATVERAAVYTFHALTAARWRVADTYLLGDAAHQMPPFLGQGLCSGIRDAANVVWKLALQHRGLAGAALLDTYEEERRAHVATAIRLSAALGRVVTGSGPMWEAGRRGGGALLRRAPALRRLLEDLGPPPLANGALAHANRPWSAVGRALPQPQVDVGEGPVPIDALLGDGFALLGMGVDPLDGATGDTVAIWHALATPRVGIVPAGGRLPVNPPEGLRWLLDNDGVLATWFTGCTSRVAAVRPDRVVLGLARSPQGLASVTAPLARLLG